MKELNLEILHILINTSVLVEQNIHIAWSWKKVVISKKDSKIQLFCFHSETWLTTLNFSKTVSREVKWRHLVTDRWDNQVRKAVTSFGSSHPYKFGNNSKRKCENNHECWNTSMEHGILKSNNITQWLFFYQTRYLQLLVYYNVSGNAYDINLIVTHYWLQYLPRKANAF